MTFVNMKRLEERVEYRIMVLINSSPSKGYPLEAIQHYFRPRGLQATILLEDVPGWEHLGENKRMNRINKVIRKLIKSGRARLIGYGGKVIDPDSTKGWTPFGGERLLPLNALDKIVYALENDESPPEASA